MVVVLAQPQVVGRVGELAGIQPGQTLERVRQSVAFIGIGRVVDGVAVAGKAHDAVGRQHRTRNIYIRIKCPNPLRAVNIWRCLPRRALPFLTQR